MKKAILAFGLIWAAAAQAAPVYECVDARGNRTYGERSGNNCKPADFRGTGFYTASAQTTATPAAVGQFEAETAPQTYEHEAGGTGVDGGRTAEARRALQQAKRDLEEGRKIRYGHERNYARYLERISALERAVAEKEAALQAAGSR
ncbi:hypothetical protein L1281_000891 [Neisseria sp. HSC-16F19]|nr:DUF4124 domain-containing protein [Neisseria sp. HSC-16F19]MCP2040309.1 hypothetical protein [Neisseria sp. HSC-16F19]